MVSRQIERDRINEMTPKVTRYQGRLLIISPGEHSLIVNFPVKFTERPFVAFGLEFTDTSWPTAFYYPDHTSAVASWVQEGEVEGAHDGYFVGCTIAVKIKAPEGTQFWLHYTFDGKALRNPLNRSDSLDDPI